MGEIEMTEERRKEIITILQDQGVNKTDFSLIYFDQVGVKYAEIKSMRDSIAIKNVIKLENREPYSGKIKILK